MGPAIWPQPSKDLSSCRRRGHARREGPEHFRRATTPELPGSLTPHAVSSFPGRESSEVPLRPLRRSDRLLSSAARGIPLRDAMRRILAFDTEHVELDEWPVHVNEHWPKPSAIRRCCIWKRPVELAAVGSATAISPSPSLQFMRHSETVERDVQPLYPEKVREHCTTTRLA